MGSSLEPPLIRSVSKTLPWEAASASPTFLILSANEREKQRGPKFLKISGKPENFPDIIPSQVPKRSGSSRP